MNAQPKVTEELSDDVREQLIEAWRVILTHSPTMALKSIAQSEMRDEIARRSPEQVERMERERGLRAS